MSVGSNLQEMENVVTKGAAAAEPMPQSGSNASGVFTPGQTGEWEDLGGPTPENYKVDDDSAKLKEPSLATVADIVKKGAKPAEPMKKMAEEEAEVEGDLPECPCVCDGGDVGENVYTYRDMLPIPLESQGRAHCELRFKNQSAKLKVMAIGVKLVMQDRPQYIEHIRD